MRLLRNSSFFFLVSSNQLLIDHEDIYQNKIYGQNPPTKKECVCVCVFVKERSIATNHPTEKKLRSRKREI